MSLPEHLAGALDTAQRVFGSPSSATAAPTAIVGLGLGTAATACAAAAAVSGPRLSVPFVMCRGAAVPAIVGPSCLVLAVSCGPDSPETLTATHQALDLGARVVAIGGDGQLARLAAEKGFPWCPIAPDGPAARAALAGATVSLLCALSRDGLVPDPAPSVSAAAASLARRRDVFVADRGPAADVARRIGRTIPLAYGASGVGAAAAQWWKSCVNLNAKSPAFFAELPGLAYDELAGWGQGGDITRQTMTLVLLRHRGEQATLPGLFASVRDATEEVMADVLEVWAEGDDDLGRFFDLALLGELVSLELADREGVDPGPVPAVEQAHAQQT